MINTVMLMMMKKMIRTWRPADKEWRTGGIQKNEGRGKPLSA